jgi:hypothetical protein
MRKFLMAAAAVSLALAASAANATEFAGTWTLTELGTSDPGLVVNATSTTGTFDIANGVLTSTNTSTINLFDLYTNESSVQSDDTHPLPIQLTFAFTTPTPTSGGVIGGSTVGQTDPLPILPGFSLQGFFQNGALTWGEGGETDVHFGAGLTGLLQVTVNGGDFNQGAFFGLDGGPRDGLNVAATFDWRNDATGAGVPEPASWALMIGGFGMAGATLRRRRATAVTA